MRFCVFVVLTVMVVLSFNVELMPCENSGAYQSELHYISFFTCHSDWLCSSLPFFLLSPSSIFCGSVSGSGLGGGVSNNLCLLALHLC